MKVNEDGNGNGGPDEDQLDILRGIGSVEYGV